MGFKVQRKAYRLKFDEPEYEGLEVTAHSIDTAQFLELVEAQMVRAEGGERAKDANRKMLMMLADALVSWNAEDEDGNPIPPTFDGMLGQDPAFNMRVLSAWTDAIAGVSAPLPQTSTDGSPSVEASIPMDVLSSSLVS